MLVARALALRAALLAAAWWVLVEGDRAGVGFGIPVVAAAAAVSLWLSPPARQPWRPLGAARFVAFFLWHSLVGGIDVARRAFSPRLPLAPALVRYAPRLPPGPARDVLAGALSLMPGSLVAGRDDGALEIHVLVGAEHAREEVEALEARVAEMMGPADG